ncbi:hypothetical protein PSHT_02076 [Puccinia striiformis]|uniref:Secreted protein n=1 Tax=Puccinia striiformis TaxID=27350 RepID=A0A2S4WJA9_9BASI|nr:hypothetical protein PSHT_02076 [Puccinia striiformis]
MKLHVATLLISLALVGGLLAKPVNLVTDPGEQATQMYHNYWGAHATGVAGDHTSYQWVPSGPIVVPAKQAKRVKKTGFNSLLHDPHPRIGGELGIKVIRTARVTDNPSASKALGTLYRDGEYIIDGKKVKPYRAVILYNHHQAMLYIHSLNEQTARLRIWFPEDQFHSREIELKPGTTYKTPVDRGYNWPNRRPVMHFLGFKPEPGESTLSKEARIIQRKPPSPGQETSPPLSPGNYGGYPSHLDLQKISEGHWNSVYSPKSYPSTSSSGSDHGSEGMRSPGSSSSSLSDHYELFPNNLDPEFLRQEHFFDHSYPSRFFPESPRTGGNQRGGDSLYLRPMYSEEESS